MTTLLEDDPLLRSIPLVEGWKVLPPVVLYAKVGQGGMGAVYRGRHLDFDIDVAVKCLKPSLAAEDDQFIARFRREARLAAGLTHENLVRIYELRRAHDIHYLVMEFVEGETARERVMRKGPLDELEAATILLGAARGLAKAHRQRDVIVHRDIKPDNILVSRRGEVKLADLGIAKALGSEEGATVATQGVLGTPQYMSPEQWERDQALGPPADVWSLGATLYYLLTGESAIKAGTQNQVYVDVCERPFPRVRAKQPQVSDALVAIIDKCTQRDMTRRYADAGELAAALEELVGKRPCALDEDDTGTMRAAALVSPPPMPTLKRIRTVVESGLIKETPPPAAELLPQTLTALPPASSALPPLEQKRPRKSLRIGAVVLSIALVGFAAVRFWPDASGATPGPVLASVDPPQGLELEAGTSRKFDLVFGEDVTSARVGGKDASINGRSATVVLAVPAGDREWIVEYFAIGPSGAASPKTLNYLCRIKPAPQIVLVDAPTPNEPLYINTTRRKLTGRVENASGGEIELSGAGKPRRRALDAAGSFEFEVAPPANSRSRLALRYGDKTVLEFELVQDSIKPVVTKTVPADGQRVRDALVDVSVEVTDDNLRDVTLRDVSLRSVPATRPSNDSWRFQRVELTEGDNDLEIVATDKAENSQTRKLKVVRDSIGPQLRRWSSSTDVWLKVGAKSEVLLEFDEPVKSATVNGQPATANGREVSVDVRPSAADPNWPLRWEVVDDLENSNSDTIFFECTEPPPISIDLGPDLRRDEKNYVQDRVLRLSATVRSASQAGVTVLVDGKKVESTFRKDQLSANLQLERNASSKVTIKDGDRVLANFDVVQDSIAPDVKLVEPAESPLLTNKTSVSIAVKAADANLDEVRLEGTAMTSANEGTWRAENVELKLEGTNRFAIRARDRAGRETPLELEVVRDTRGPTLVDSTPKNGGDCAPGKNVRVQLTFDERIAAVIVEGRETPAENSACVSFTAAVPSGEGAWTLEGTVRDVAGNTEPFSLRLMRNANASVTTVKFPGFTRVGDELNSLGYPRLIEHNETKIQLIALDFVDDAKPTLYVSTGFVTEFQFRRKGSRDSDSAAGSVKADDAEKWCRTDRGRGLDIPTVDDWNRMSKSSVGDIRNPTLRRNSELLRPPTDEFKTAWPTRDKSGRDGVQSRTTTFPELGFRVVFHVP